jgi:hypothetical protein
MKKCPQCNQLYPDDSFVFCLDDGAALSDTSDNQETQVLSFSPQKNQANAGPANRKSNAIYFVVLILAVLLTGSMVALFYERTKENSNKDSLTQIPVSRSIESDQAENAKPDINTPQNRGRFSVSSCGSINDDSTKLEWFVGPDKNMTWNEAQQWTMNLAECGGGWRMPAAEEIRVLYDPSKTAGKGYYTNGKYFPAHIDQVFSGIGGGSWVWTDRSFGSEAQSYNLNQGKTVTYAANNTVYSTRAFAVRSAKK